MNNQAVLRLILLILVARKWRRKAPSPWPLIISLTNPMPSLKSNSPITDFAEKIKELLLLAQEQGYLTHEDLLDTLENATPAHIEEVRARLGQLEVEIVE